MKILKSIQLFYHSMKLLRNPDNNIKSLLFVGDEIAQSKASKEAVHLLYQNRSIHHMYLWKEGLDQMDLNQLELCRKGSFGRDIYAFYKSRSLNVYPMKDREDLNALTYVSERVRKVHDLLHVLLQYDTDLIGEAKVNAFVANQTRMPMSFLILSGIVIKYFFKHPMQFQTLIREVEDGWRVANGYQNFLSIDWDLLYDLPTDEVRMSFAKYSRLHAA